MEDKEFKKELFWPISAAVIICIFLFGAATALKWYRADVQRQVWEREGIELTTWEIFNNATPSINITIK